MSKDKDHSPGTKEGRGDSPAAAGGSGSPSFRVVDKRHWAGGEDSSGEDKEPRRVPSHVEKLEKMLEEKDEQLQQTIARYRKAAEEYDASSIRLRKESAKEIEKGRRAAIVEFLSVLDSFDRALEAASGSRNFDSFLEGVELIKQQFMEKLAAFGVNRIDSLGKKFDPERHEVVSQVPVDDPEKDGKIAGVIDEGYWMGDSLLRPATVAVCKFNDDKDKTM